MGRILLKSSFVIWNAAILCIFDHFVRFLMAPYLEIGAVWPRGSSDLLSHCWVWGSQKSCYFGRSATFIFHHLRTSMILNGVYLKSRSVRRFFLLAKSYICQPAFHMTKLDFKRILRGSIIRCRSATLSPTASVKPKAMPARRDYCKTDSPHVNIDSVRAKADFRGFLSYFSPF